MLFNTFKSKITFGAFCLLIVLLVTLPLSSAKELNNITILHLRGDYFFHLLLFMPWAFFIGAMKKNRWLWLLLGLLFSFLSELIQYYIPYRAFNTDLTIKCRILHFAQFAPRMYDRHLPLQTSKFALQHFEVQLV